MRITGKKICLLFFGVATAALICVGVSARRDRAPTSENSSISLPVSSMDISQSQSETGSKSETNSRSGEEQPASEELNPPTLILYTTELANNIGQIGYDEQKLFDGRSWLEERRAAVEKLHLVPCVDENGEGSTALTGHRLYVKPDDTGGQQYIVSGVELLPVENGIPDTRMSVKLRREGTCERVRMFSSQDDMDQARLMWAQGQAILTGEQAAPAACVILNGSLLENVQWEQRDDGRIYLPMTDVAKAYDEQSAFYDVEGWLNVAVDQRFVILPTALAPDEVLEHFEVADGTWRYATDRPPVWSDRFYLPQTEKTEMPIEDISRILGWKIYTGEGIVSIVTSELDVNDNFVLINTQTTEHVYDMDGKEIETKGTENG